MIHLDHLLEATRGKLHQPGKDRTFTNFSHDTRQLQPGELFVAVRGPRGNGHDHLLDAVEKGATGLLVESKTFNALSNQAQTALAQADVTILIVEDTRLALREYAAAILQRWQPTVIAVTGSVGKTSTKEAIATLLASRFPTFRSWQNYNDLLGIPLSLGQLEEQHRYAVLELGGDHPGEIADLCRLLRPRIGVLTNINAVHLQYFGSSIERLANEMGMLLTSLPEGGHFFYNQDDESSQALVEQYLRQPHPAIHLQPFLTSWEKTASARVTRVSWDGIQGTLSQVTPTKQGDGSREERLLTSRLLGAHHLQTMLAAYRVATTLSIPAEEAAATLANIDPLTGRLNPLPGIHKSRLLDDTHNASPTSLLAGLATLHNLTSPPGRRIAVLGDMLQLGNYTEKAHREIGTRLPQYVDYLVTHGEYAALLAESAQRAGLEPSHIIVTSTHEDAARAVRTLLEEATAKISSQGDVVLIKGSEETRMERVTEILMARPWEASEKLVRQTPGWKKTVFRHADRPTWVEIDLNAIGSNTRHLKALIGPAVRILAPLKADAYGHGALKVARTVLHNGASMLGVATVSEAIPLREGNITAPILVFGYVPFWQMREAIRLDVGVTLYTSESAHELSRTAQSLEKTVRVHVKVDTGMGRLGIFHEQREEIVALVREITTLPGLELEGIYTHFAQADAAEQTHVRTQLARFQQILSILEELGLRPPLVHAANSAGTLALPEARFDMIRPGVAIYGLDPSPAVRLPEGFRPALAFKTQVSQVKWLPAGEGISYGSTYITAQPTHIAVLPVGYADGFRRSPRNWGTVLIRGQEAPILGRVCMDQCMIDITNIPDVQMGDEVVLIGRQGEAGLTAEQVAERLGTVNYEVVSEILARVPRVD
jgi:alanine racemase